MSNSRQSGMQVAVLIAFGILIIGLAGCGGSGASIRGQLNYQDASVPTVGDSVWVQLLGNESVGATVPVKADNTWVYSPKGKNIRAWAGGAPPVKSKNKNEANPVLVFQAVTETHRTNAASVDYGTLKTRKDKSVRLTYESMTKLAPKESDNVDTPPNDDTDQMP